MLNYLSLQNFKCYQDKTRFDLGKINLLTGINGKGKSSFLQSLLLFRQSVEHNPNTTSLLLNGSCVRLGDFSDIKNSNTSVSQNIHFEFGINYDNFLYNTVYNFVRDDKNDRILLQKDSQKPLASQPFNYQNIHYISADRLGPQEFYTKNNISDFVNVGKQGEFVADVLSFAKREQIVANSNITRSEATDILSQTGEYLGFILDSPNLNVKLDDTDKYRSSISFRMNGNDYTPPNVGFGYSYTLPIIVAGLIAKSNEILIVENPEAHLHPRAQSRLAQFLVKVANTGVQIFIESHSDHILNALRVEVKKEAIAHQEVKVFFFANQDNNQNTTPEVFNLEIDADGRIEEWPDGFFDEWNNNLIELL
jgi:predicted ATPase